MILIGRTIGQLPSRQQFEAAYAILEVDDLCRGVGVVLAGLSLCESFDSMRTFPDLITVFYSTQKKGNSAAIHR